MENFEAIFLDKLDVCDDEYEEHYPILWCPELNDKLLFLQIDEDSYKFKRKSNNKIIEMERDQDTIMKKVWPHKYYNDWDRWREFLFINDVDFIAPKSYLQQSMYSNSHYYVNEILGNLPYLVYDIENKKVLTAFNQILTIDNLEDYRYATFDEINGFFHMSNKCGFSVKKDDDNRYYFANKNGNIPKFIPGDVVMLKDYVTEKNFMGYFIVGDLFYADGFNYTLLGRPEIPKTFIIEDYLVKCEVIPISENKIKQEEKEEEKEEKLQILL